MAKSPFGFNQPEESPGFLLWQTTITWQRRIKKALDAYEISHAQFVILAALLYLANQNESVNQKMLSDFTGIDKMSTSDLIATLLKKKMIKKTKKASMSSVKTQISLWILCSKKNGNFFIVPALIAFKTFTIDFIES